MLSLTSIKAVYGGVVLALEDVSLSVADGGIAVLLGSNGSGKSTTLKSISGVLKTEEGELTQGKIELDGRRIDSLDPERIASLGVRHLLQGRSVFQQLTTEENLMMGAYLRRDRAGIRQDLSRMFDYFPALAPLRRRKGGYLSGGEQQMLVIARALMSRPRMILLDEPSLGLAPGIIGDLFAILTRIRAEEKTSLLIAEQNAAAALAMADHGYVLQNGRLVASGTAAELRHHPQVRSAYMGLSADGSFRSRHDTPQAPDA